MTSQQEVLAAGAACGGDARSEAVVVHRSMPPLQRDRLYPVYRRRLHDLVFYIVPALMWIALSLRHMSVTLPTAANPKMEVGGLWGERKSQDLRLFGERAARRLAPYVAFKAEGLAGDLAMALARLEDKGLGFPIVVKPDRGYQGWGVRKVEGPDELAAYLANVLPGTGLILQRFVAHDGEAAVFYIREPGASRGRIASMVLTYAPHVVGDGNATLEALVDADPVLAGNREVYRERHRARWRSVVPANEVVTLTVARSARLGAVYRNAAHLVTPELERTIEEIARDIPEFHFGRFDLRFRSLDELRHGEGLSILELNGAGAEMLHIWDGRTRLRDAYRTLWRQYRTLFAIAAENRRRGHRPAGIGTMLALQRRQEHLRRAYPTST